MKINRNNPGTWFDLPDDEPKPNVIIKSRICLRMCNAEVLEEINEQTIKHRDIFKKGQHFEKVEVDEKLRNRLIWDYTIVDWQGLQDENGVDIPCTTDAKVALMSGSPVFVKIVSERLDILVERNEELARVSEKNSSSTSSDST